MHFWESVRTQGGNMDIMFYVFKFIGMFILSTVIIAGVAFIGFLFFRKTMEKADNLLYTFLLGCGTGTASGYILYILYDILK